MKIDCKSKDMTIKTCAGINKIYIWNTRFMGVFNYLPSLWMAPLQKSFLFWFLYFYHFYSRGANYFSFLLMWHAKSSCQHGSSMQKDYDAPSLTQYTMLSSLLSLWPVDPCIFFHLIVFFLQRAAHRAVQSDPAPPPRGPPLPPRRRPGLRGWWCQTASTRTAARVRRAARCAARRTAAGSGASSRGAPRPSGESISQCSMCDGEKRKKHVWSIQTTVGKERGSTH